MTSAYPITVAELTERVKAFAIDQGKIPTRNRIKSEFNVGAPKANAVLAALEETGFDPANPNPADEVSTVRRLHSVPATETTEPIAEPVTDDQPGTDTEPAPVVQPVPAPVVAVEQPASVSEVSAVVDPVPAVVEQPETPADTVVKTRVKPVRSWPLLLLAAGAFVAIWGGWVGLGELTGFGPIRLLPGIADSFVINSAITLPIGVEAYAAYALRVWLSGRTRSSKARRFARWSAIGSLVLGAAGQVAYHLMVAAGVTTAPWWITTFVSCLPVVVLGCGAALTHLLNDDDDTEAQR
ncbi:ABC transporter permease [Lentzea sp. NPDC058450]|uniref:ABC transporter permease n=1 Tax=Lentzea sp. NPDC058450 TaxID=3346505 RepID=UPI00365F2C63